MTLDNICYLFQSDKIKIGDVFLLASLNLVARATTASVSGYMCST